VNADADSEFAFELRVCRWAEREWPPRGDRDDAVLVARQLGTERRRWDTVVIECDPAALAARARFGPERLDSDLRHVLRDAPADWAWYRDVLPDPGYPWRYVREAIHRAADRDVLETRTDGNRLQIRRRYPYPDWVRRVIAIENKPDLDASAARRLREQIEYDVALGLADEAWLATRATDDRVPPALLEHCLVEAGVLVVDDGDLTADVAWNPRSLAVDAPGTRILDRPSGGAHDRSAARFEYADPEWKAEKRRDVAERAYERGWRSFVDTMRPDCRSFELQADGQLLPYCHAKDCHPTAAECAGSCSEFAPEPPAWRTKSWPIAGGPGSRLRTLLSDRRDRRRPDRPKDDRMNGVDGNSTRR